MKFEEDRLYNLYGYDVKRTSIEENEVYDAFDYYHLFGYDVKHTGLVKHKIDMLAAKKGEPSVGILIKADLSFLKDMDSTETRKLERVFSDLESYVKLGYKETFELFGYYAVPNISGDNFLIVKGSQDSNIIVVVDVSFLKDMDSTEPRKLRLLICDLERYTKSGELE